jgi:hypothetical protein
MRARVCVWELARGPLNLISRLIAGSRSFFFRSARFRGAGRGHLKKAQGGEGERLSLGEREGKRERDSRQKKQRGTTVSSRWKNLRKLSVHDAFRHVRELGEISMR